jgi:putative salt-induced outer membrane protein YdiY
MMRFSGRFFRSLGALRRTLALAAVLLGSSAGSAPAEDDWTPPEPSEAGWEWARLDTGEWLKGELITMHQDVMVFESDKFDELTIDWEDVYDLRLARPRVFRRIGRLTYAGMGEVRDGVLRILTISGEEIEFPASELVSIVYSSESEIRNWRVKIGASLAARSGNTDQQDLTANAQITRDATFTRWKTTYVGTFSKVDGDDTVNNHRARTELDFLVTSRFFIRFPAFEFFSDEFQNIDARYTQGGAIGYQLIDNPIVDYEVTAGAAAQITEYSSAGREEDAAGIFTSELSLDFPHDIDFDLDYVLQLVVTDLGKTNHNTSAILSFEIWDPLDLDVGAYWDRVESPEKDNDGSRPKKDDFRLTVGLSLDF